MIRIKGNERETYEALRIWFEEETPFSRRRTRTYTMVDKGHGRIERYTVAVTEALNEYLQQELGWPDVQQALCVRREWWDKGGKHESIRYGLTSLDAGSAPPPRLLALWKGHWNQENRVHWVLDVTFGEDGSRLRRNRAFAMSVFRHVVLALLRFWGYTNIRQARAFIRTHVSRAFAIASIPLE